MQLYDLLPQAIRLMVWKALLGHPQRARRYSGTITVTMEDLVAHVEKGTVG